MISAQTLCVCREGKPVSTFPDHSLERFPAKWTPVRVKKTRQNKKLEPRSDSIGTEKALEQNRSDPRPQIASDRVHAARASLAALSRSAAISLAGAASLGPAFSFLRPILRTTV